MSEHDLHKGILLAGRLIHRSPTAGSSCGSSSSGLRLRCIYTLHALWGSHGYSAPFPAAAAEAVCYSRGVRCRSEPALV